jgi:hypothetical protein
MQLFIRENSAAELCFHINIIMSKYCVHLNLNINPVTIDHSNLKKSYQTKIQIENLNPEFIAILHNRDVIAYYAESFYSPPNYFQPIHTDNLGGDYVKINFVYGGHGSQMNWYKLKEPSSTPPVVTKTLVNTDYISWKADEVDLVESDPLNYPSIVQVGCPHNVVNTNDYRLCISVVLINND